MFEISQKGHQKFCVLHQNKALYNFRKRGQRSIVELDMSRICPAGSIKFLYVDNIISPTLKKCKSLKKLFTGSANDHALQSFEVIF